MTSQSRSRSVREKDRDKEKSGSTEDVEADVGLESDVFRRSARQK